MVAPECPAEAVSGDARDGVLAAPPRGWLTLLMVREPADSTLNVADWQGGVLPPL